MTHPSASSRPADPLGWMTQLTADDSTQQENCMGCIRTEYDNTYGMQKYIYVFNNWASDLSDGDVCAFTGKIYDGKVSPINTNADLTAGVAFGTITASQYGWIQVYGYHDYVKVWTAGDIGAGAMLCKMSVGLRGIATDNSGGTLALGITVAADTTTSVEAFLSVATIR